ncbi:MAG: hypothetical protein H6895_12635 [Defluviimonas sp.]|nr:hypothetical protein [Defluviimonas sp.]
MSPYRPHWVLWAIGAVLGGVLGALVCMEQGLLLDAGLSSLAGSPSAPYFWPVTVATLALAAGVIWLYGRLPGIYRHRREIILYSVTVAPFFAGLNLGPIDPSDPAFLLAFLAVIMMLSVEREDLRLEPFVFACSMIIVVFCFTSIFAGRIGTIVQLHTIITKVLLVFIVVNLIRDETYMRRFVVVFLAAAAISAVLAILSEALFLVTGVPLTLDDAVDFHFKATPIGLMLRATAFFASTQGLAHVMVVATALALGAPLRMGLVKRAALLAVLGLGCLSTFSTGSYLAIGLVYVLAPFVLFPRHWIAILASYAGLGVLLSYFRLIQLVVSDVLIPLGLRNFLERVEFIQRGIRGAENWPWTGNGIGNIGRQLETAIHNAYVQSIVDIGVIGGGAFLAIVLYLLLRNLFLRPKSDANVRKTWAPAISLVMIGVSVHLLLEPFFNNTLTWLVLGVATANIIISRGDHRYGRIPVSQDFKEELELSLSGYLSTLYRMRFLILLVMISAGVFAYYYSRTLVPQYEAVAQFYIPDDATRSGRAEGELPVAPIPSGNRDGVTAAVSLLRTDELRRRVNELVPEKPFAELDLDVDPVVERSSMVLVYARDADPQVAAKVANSYYYAFVNFVQQQQSAQQAVALERTLARLAELDAEIERSAQSDRDRMVRLLGLRETLTDTQRNLEKQALSMSEIAIMASPATPPVGPVFPIMPLNVVVSMIAGLVLGILYVVLIDHVRMSRRRRRHLQLEQETIVQDILSDLAPAKFIRS